MRVLKFGGSSVAGPEAIAATYKIVAQSETPLLVVVSALGGVTDLLLDATRLAALQQDGWRESLEGIEKRYLDTVRGLLPLEAQAGALSRVKKHLNTLETLLEGAWLIGESTPKLDDKIVSYGELLSAFVIAEYYRSQGIQAEFQDSRELIETDNTFGNARVNQAKTYAKVTAALQGDTPVVVLPGFIASNAQGDTTTLGRGGSDYSAALFAGALQASELEIWTDVSGMYTANPKLVSGARPIPTLSYEEAMELSHFGAKVLSPTIRPALQANIPILIRNTFKPEERGTRIEVDGNPHGRTVRGISYVPGIALLSLEGPGDDRNSGYQPPFLKSFGKRKSMLSLLPRHLQNILFVSGSGKARHPWPQKQLTRPLNGKLKKGDHPGSGGDRPFHRRPGGRPNETASGP